MDLGRTTTGYAGRVGRVWRRGGGKPVVRPTRRRGVRGWMAAVVMMGAVGGAAFAGPVDPDKIADMAELRRELSAQVLAVRNAWQGGKQLADALAAARNAWTQQLAAVEPGRQQLAALTQRIVAIDNYDFWHEAPDKLTNLIEMLQTRQQKLERDLDLHVAVTPRSAPDPRGEQLRQAIDELKAAIVYYTQLRQQVRQALPNLQRPFPEGQTSAAHRATLIEQHKQLTAQLKPGEDELTRRGEAVRSAITAATNHDDRVAEAERRYYQLLYVLHRRFTPPHVTEVKLAAPFDPRSDERVYYHAVIDEPKELQEIDAKIAALVEQLPTVGRRVVESRDLWANSEEKFTRVTDRWLEKNEQYAWVTRKEYLLNIAAETADAVIGTASDGFTPPAVLFELAWRVGEAVNNDFRIAEPKVDDALLEYRQRISRELTPTPDNPLPPTASNEQILRAVEHRLRESRKYQTLSVTAGDIVDNQVDEALKGAAGNAFGLLAERMAEEALKRGGKVEGRRLMHAMTILALHPDAHYDTLNRLWDNRSTATMFENLDRAIAGGVADRADTLVKKLKEPGTYGDIVKGFALAATVTVLKDAVKNDFGYAAERARLMADMAVLDIEWFARRAEYHAAGHFHRQCQQMLAGYKAKIGQLYQQRADIARRQMRVIVDKPFATMDKVYGEVTFNRPVTGVSVRLGEVAPTKMNLRGDSMAATFELIGSPFSVGDVRVVIEGQRKDVTGVPLDADATTVARYAGPTISNPGDRALWAGIETGPDQRHAFKAAAPTLELADADAARGYIPGDRVGVKFTLPGSLPYQRLRLTAIPMDNPVELDVPAQAEGKMQFHLPEKAGAYRLVIVGGPRVSQYDDEATKAAKYAAYVQVAETRVTAGLTVLRSQPGGPFTKVTEYELPSRGPWFEPSGSAIEAGKGRLLFERRDAASQLASYHVAVRPAGSDSVIWSGWSSEADLAPDVYDVTFSTTVPTVFRNVTVAAGQVTHLKSEPLGRLELRTYDALGVEISAHRNIYRKSDNAHVYAGWTKVVDLPPGQYKVVYGYTVPIEQETVIVESGRSVQVEASGYGRFELKTFDALGQEINPHRNIYRKSDNAHVYAGWTKVVDLPPDQYKVVYGYTVPMEFDNQALAAGKVTTVTSTALGRFEMSAYDGLGQEANPHRNVYRKSDNAHVYAGWRNVVDLPPGQYKVVFAYTEPMEFDNQTLSNGKVTSVTAAGLGRLTVRAVDAAGQPTSRHFEIFRGETKIGGVYSDRSVDLRPGNYVLKFRSGDEDRQLSVTVARHAETPINVAVR